MKTLKLITALIFVGSLSACMSTNTQYETTVNADGSRKTTCSNTGGSVWDNACEAAAANNSSHQQIGSHTSGNIGVRTNRGGQWADHAKNVAKPTQQEQSAKKTVPSSNAGGNHQAAAVVVEQEGGNALVQLLAEGGYGNVTVQPQAVVIENVASFEKGSYELSLEDKRKLNELAFLLIDAGVEQVEVTAFADATPYSEGNRVLTDNRSWAIASILQNLGIYAENGRTQGETGRYGDNRTAEGQTANRTAKITIFI